ncbi:MAG TPA: hypothetical protein VGM37_19310 [Armatimonadota bacterium]|jgi:hypothetical protein
MRSAIIPAVLSLIWAAHAQTGPQPPAPTQDIPHQLERLAAGKPLPLVVVAPTETAFARRPPTVVDFANKPLLTALQDLGDACSYKRGDEAQMPPYAAAFFRRRFPQWMPFQCGAAWTIAPEFRVDLNADPGEFDPLGALQPWGAVETLVRSLTRDQLRIATGSGIRYPDLTMPQRAAMRAAFERPLGLLNTDAAPAPGAPPRGWLNGFNGRLPVDQCTLHVYLTYTSVGWKEGGSSTLMIRGVQPILLDDDEGPGDIGLPLRTQTPNALRPQDLAFDAPALDRPIAMKGISTVGKLVSAAAKATGMPLKVVHGWEALPAFAGDARMRAGDVLRLLAFDLQGTWRRVGKTYLLAWDRAGLGARNMELSEKLTALRKAANAARAGLNRAGWNEDALNTLGPDPGLPIGPSPEQTAIIRARAEAAHSSEASLSFADLTPQQQDALVAATAGRFRFPDKRPITRDLLQTATLSQPTVHTTLDVPGVGNVDLGFIGAIRLDFFSLQPDGPNPPAAVATAPEPPRLPPGVRGVAPPALGRASWLRLLEQMRRKGLDTLYLPVFWDGQTLFPSKQFPALPTARDHDVLREVLASAKDDGIRVIAVIHALAWRFPDSKAHWLTKRPDLVDVDALGRGRWDWGAAHEASHEDNGFGNPSRIVADDPILLSDFVRPGDPEVRRRLLGLIAELRRYKDLDGVALAHWSRLAGRGYNADSEYCPIAAAPGLGFSLRDRERFLAAHGEDPVDILDRDACFQLPCDEPRSFLDEWNKNCFAQDAALANLLLAEMEKGWPGRVQTFCALGRFGERKLPAGDVTVRDNEVDAADKAVLRRVTVPASPPNGGALKDDDEVRAARLDDFANQLRHAAIEAKRPPTAPPLRGLALDLTASPDLLWDALAVLPNRTGATAGARGR